MGLDIGDWDLLLDGSSYTLNAKMFSMIYIDRVLFVKFDQCQSFELRSSIFDYVLCHNNQRSTQDSTAHYPVIHTYHPKLTPFTPPSPFFPPLAPPPTYPLSPPKSTPPTTLLIPPTPRSNQPAPPFPHLPANPAPTLLSNPISLLLPPPSSQHHNIESAISVISIPICLSWYAAAAWLWGGGQQWRSSGLLMWWILMIVWCSGWGRWLVVVWGWDGGGECDV